MLSLFAQQLYISLRFLWKSTASVWTCTCSHPSSYRFLTNGQNSRRLQYKIDHPPHITAFNINTTTNILVFAKTVGRIVLNVVDISFTALSEADFCSCLHNPAWFEFSVLVSHLCLVINSSLNFVIYFSSSDLFKTIFFRKLRPERGTPDENEPQSLFWKKKSEMVPTTKKHEYIYNYSKTLRGDKLRLVLYIYQL